MKLKQQFKFLPKSKIKAGEGLTDGKYPFFTSSDIQVKKINDFIYNDEAIILGTGGLPSCNYYNGKFSTSTDNFVLNSNGNIKPKFLYYFLRYNNLQILSKGFKGSGLKHISKAYVENIDIPFLDKDEQNIIIKTLDDINCMINSAKNEISQLGELIKSRFNEMFGDPILNECNFKTIQLKALTQLNSIKGKVEITKNTWLLNLDMIESNTGNVISKLRTSKVDGSTIEFNTTCVLYSKLRPYLNKVVVPDEAGYATSELISLKCDPKQVNRTYLAAVFRHKSFVDYINSKTSGAKMPRVNMNEFKKFTVPVPRIDMQNKFSSFVEQIDKLKFKHKAIF